MAGLYIYIRILLINMFQLSRVFSYLKKQQKTLLFFSLVSIGYPVSKFIFTRVHTYLFPPEKPKTDIERYIEQQLDKLNHFLEKCSSKQERNTNISEEFYNKKKLSVALEEANNQLEKTWKTRMLFENTPRGNIVMYYDPYKMGFAYYSDNTGIPYNMLNAVAMKYVRMFRCHDFFFDNQDIKEESPLIKIHSEEDKKDMSEEEKKESDEFKAKLKNAPFLKRKKTEQKKEDKENKEHEQKKTEEEKDEGPQFYNCFVHMGKMYNLSFLNVPAKVQQNRVSFSSGLLDALDQETELQKQVMSWKDYKKGLKVDV